jgi:hypothetical protein
MITNSLSASATAYFKPAGGSALTITNGRTILAYCTGSAMVELSGSITATTATNLAGGVASQIPYQSAAGTTSFIANGTSGQVLQSNGTAVPTFVAQLSLAVGSATTATTATNATNLVTTNFTITESGGKLLIKYGATTVASISSTGAITSANNVTAYGTP